MDRWRSGAGTAEHDSPRGHVTWAPPRHGLGHSSRSRSHLITPPSLSDLSLLFFSLPSPNRRGEPTDPSPASRRARQVSSRGGLNFRSRARFYSRPGDLPRGSPAAGLGRFDLIRELWEDGASDLIRGLPLQVVPGPVLGLPPRWIAPSSPPSRSVPGIVCSPAYRTCSSFDC